ncbi:LPD38 domain-containing protein [Paenibacillus odorifer]|uniref:LPD38 domain-containing protein n=1 Tax=Paenibacillus odorifer TaxID=189426 RepID=UPI00096FEDAE|nr:LPD38 domain-containing protein [Paenibacillus odorifer]OMD92705.1 hypothetical protein BSK67_18250 [Paenibacillus odorifer]
MSLFDAARNRKRGEDAKQRVLERVYSPKEEESTKEDMFSGVRNRSLNVETATPEPVVSKEPTAASQVLKIALDGVLTPSPVATKKQDTKQETKKESIGSKIMDVAQGFNAFTDRAKSAATFGGTELIDKLFTKIGTDESKQAMQEKLDRADNVKGGLAADVIGSLMPGDAAFRAGGMLINPLIKNAPKAVQTLTRGAAGGALFQGGVEAGRALNGDQQSLSNAAKNIGMSAALGGAGDLALSGIGSALGKVFSRNAAPQIQTQTPPEIFALPEGRGTVRQAEALNRSNLPAGTDPIINPPARSSDIIDITPRQESSMLPSLQSAGSGDRKFLSQSEIEELLRRSAESPNTPNIQDIPSTPTRRSAYQRLLDETTDRVPIADATPEVNAAPMRQDMFTDLFGDQGLGISATGSSSRVGTGPIDTADQIVRSSIRNDKEGLKQAAAAQARATYQNLVDSLSPLKKIGDDVYESAMDATRANNIANTVVRDKLVNLQGEVVGSSLNDIFKKVARGQDKNFIDYLTLRHAKTRMGRGERVYAENLGMTPEKVQQRIQTLNERYPGFEEIAQEWDKFNDNILREFGVNEGLLSTKAYNAMKEQNPNYSPMKRQFSRSEKPGRSFIQKSTKSSFSGQNAPIQNVSPTGSVRNIVDPRKSTIESVGAWTNAALRNRTMQSIVKAIKRDPDAFDGVISFADVADNVKQSSINEMNNIIESDGIEGLLTALDNDFEMLFNKGKNINLSEDNVVRAMVDGEPVYLKVHDPEIVKALMGMGPQASNVLIDTMSAFSNATKRGATGLLAPAFAIKGATMDLAQAAIQSKQPVKQIGYTVGSIFSGIGDALNIPGLRNWAQEYRRAGGGYTASLKGDRKLNTSIADMTRDPLLSPKGIAKGARKAVTAPFKALEGLGNIAENAPRIAAAKLERESLGNQITPENIRQAMSAGREVTVNFSRKGALTRDIEAFVPYNNAAVQGTYRVLRAFKKNPVRTVAAIGTLAVLPKMYEYSKFSDDPDYQNLPARERMRNLIVKKNDDGTFVKIPMEPAYNSFGEATIEALRYFKDNDPKAFKGSMDALANAWTPPLLTGALQGITKGDGAEGSIAGVVNSTVAAPFVASVANQSFTGAPIVSQALQDRSKQYQYDERTSSVAKKIGETMKMSPQKVDYIIKSYGGDLARLVLPLTSDLGQGNARNTLLKNFIVDPQFSNTLTDDFYTAKDKLNQAYANFNEADVELPSWYDDDLRKALNSSAKGSVSKQLSELRDWKKEVTADKSLPDKERTKKIREIQQQINEIYINVNSVLSESGVIK